MKAGARINADVKEIDSKIQKIKDDMATKLNTVDKKVDGNPKGLDVTEVNKLIKTYYALLIILCKRHYDFVQISR